MKHYILYSSKECCLCDDAMALIEQIKAERAVTVSKVDIYQDKALLIKYRTRIPVLKEEGGTEKSESRELGWPFSLETLREWLD